MALRHSWLGLTACFVASGLAANAAAEVSIQTAPDSIAGADTASGAAFRAERTPTGAARAWIDAKGTRYEAIVDYNSGKLVVTARETRSGALTAVRREGILAVQDLRENLAGKIPAGTVQADVLASLADLIASAPENTSINIKTGLFDYHNICSALKTSRNANYSIGWRRYSVPVTVGPVCYAPPSMGRCGLNEGPDLVVGQRQRYTQECLNHDQCCVATGRGAPVCGSACAGEFFAAAAGFFAAPDCGTTQGAWRDNFANVYTLRGGEGDGGRRTVTGTVRTASCGVWAVSGVRRGRSIDFTATNPATSSGCARSFRYVGTYGDCTAASGGWTNSSGQSGNWSWTRVTGTQAAALPVGPSPTSTR
jgi:hypothetical protein